MFILTTPLFTSRVYGAKRDIDGIIVKVFPKKGGND